MAMRNRQRGCFSEDLTFWGILTNVKPMVPIVYLDKAKEIPPSLIIHGNKDRLVPFGQSVMFYNALKQNKQIRDNIQTRWG